MRTLFLLVTAFAAVLLLPAAALADGHSSQTFTATITQANDSGGSATATITLNGTTADISIQGQGFFDGFPHAMHLHGEPGGNNVCGPLNPGDDGFEAADEDGDGFINVVESAPNYGPIAVSLTTEGDTSPDSGLAVDRFPTSGTLEYRRTIELSDEVAQNLSTMHIVVHGADLDDSGEIGDLGIPSDLDPELDLEATVPAACGQITAQAAGGVATGAGGAADTSTSSAGLLAGGAGLAALGGVVARRRVTR